MNEILIKSGQVINPLVKIVEKLDIAIKDGIVVGVGNNANVLENPKIIDASDCYVSPGLIDLAVRFREPGLEQEATVERESKAAISSGVTTVCYMPDTQPVIDTPGQVKLVQNIFNQSSDCKVYPLAALTRNLNGDQLSSMMELRQAGAIGVTNCLYPMKTPLVLRRAMEYAAGQDLIFFYQPLNHSLSNNGCAHEGKVATRLGLTGIPSAAEASAVAEAIELMKLTNVKLHLCRISSFDSLSLILDAQKSGLDISFDIAIHQLFFTEESLNGYNTMAHVQPPYRTEEDLTKLRDALEIGRNNMAICSDHQPHNQDAKKAPFPETQSGISTIQLLLPLLLEIVNDGISDLPSAISKVTYGPAKILGLNSGIIKEGLDADICIFRKNKWKFTIDKNLSSGENSPFFGREFNNRVEKTICRGKIVFDINELNL